MTPAHRTPSDHSSCRARRWAPALALLGAGFLAACGGDDDGTPADTTPPTVVVSDDVATGAASGDITFSFTFSEDVGASFAASDVAVSAGTKGAFVKASATLYTLVVSPPANAAGDLTVTVPAGAFTDIAGNANVAAASDTQAYDTVIVLGQMDLPVTFDSPTVEYGLVGFGGADDSTIVVDPTDAGNHVAKVVKSATAETWAGTTITVVDTGVQLGFASPIPFDASNTRMTVDVWSPDAGIQVRLKAEDHTSAAISVETEATTTLASAWETLTFDFADQAAGTAPLDVSKSYDKVSIFFNFGVGGATAGEKTYYFDDVVFIGGGGTGGGGEPTAPPARPTVPAADVISLLSDAYTNVAVDTWRTTWSAATLEDVTIGADHVKKYSSLDFVGIETTGANLIDATQMTHVHLDLWTPNATTFRIKLVDWGANGTFDGPGAGDDKEHEIALTSSTSPALAIGQWVSVDLPLSAFTGLTTRAHLAQHILSALPTGAVTAYLVNYYFYRSVPTAPAAPPARPTKPAADVISLLSDAYTNVPVDTWRTSWSAATLEDVTIGTDHVKKYSSLDFVGVETTGANLVNATDMTHVHLDVWTPDATTIRVKLVDFGADGLFGGGDDREHELALTSATTPALVPGQWVGVDVPLAAFTGLTTRAHLAQYIFSALPAGTPTLYVVNFYFYKEAAPAGPTVAAPTPPARNPADVISLFSDAYANVPIDTWKTSWTPASVVLTDPYDIPGTADDAKRYQFASDGNYAGVEFVGANMIDATAMTHFHVDVWTPDATNFQVKLVDFGAGGVFGGGDDTEGILTLPGPALPTLGQGQWVSVDAAIDATNFPGLAARAHLAQMVFVSGAGAASVYVDNVYFHK